MASPLGRSSSGYSGSSSGYPGSAARSALSDFLPPGMTSAFPPLSGAPSPAHAPRGVLHRPVDGRRRDTLFAEGRADDTPDGSVTRPTTRGPPSPDVLPSGAEDLMAHLAAVEAVNREQAAALHRLGHELHFLRSGGLTPPPATAVSVAGDVARDRRIADLEAALLSQQRSFERLLAAHGSPADAAPKNHASKYGLLLRADPAFTAMSITPTSTADDVARMVRAMLEPFGTIANGDDFKQLLLWVFQLPATDLSSVPAVATAAVSSFCEARGLPLDPRSGASLTTGVDCFGTGLAASHRRLICQHLVAAVSVPGELQNIDKELLVSFRSRLSALRLSDSDMALPSFVALLGRVLHFLNHGPASVLASVVEAFFTCAPHEPVAHVNHQIRKFQTALESSLGLWVELQKYPTLLPTLLAAAVAPYAPGAPGTALQLVVTGALDRAADPSTTPSDLVAYVTGAPQSTGTVGAEVVSWDAPPATNRFRRLLHERAPAGPSVSPAAAAMSASSPTRPAALKSATSKSTPRPAQATAKSAGGTQREWCPDGPACPRHGSFATPCSYHHKDEDFAVIKARLAQLGLPFFNAAMRSALRHQMAAGGEAPPSAPSPSAAAVAPTQQPVPPPPPAVEPSQSAPPAALGAASLDRMAALTQFLNAAAATLGGPAQTAPPTLAALPTLAAPRALAALPPLASQSLPPAALGVPSAARVAAMAHFLNGTAARLGAPAGGTSAGAAPPAFAALPPSLAVLPAAMAAAAVAARPAGQVWGGSADRRLVVADTGTRRPYAPNTAGAPARRVPDEACVTSTGALSVTNREFSATFPVQGADKGPFYEVTIDGVREQPGLALPAGPGRPSGPVPVMLLDPTSIAKRGGELYVGPQYATGVRGEEPSVMGWIRLPIRNNKDDPLAPDVRLSKKIFGDFSTGVFALPTCDLPVGAVPIPVSLGGPSAPLSASSIALTVPEQSFVTLLSVCEAWHSVAAPLVPAYAAMSPLEQAAFRACHGGRGAAAQLHLGLSLFASCLDDLAPVVLRGLGAPA